MPIGRLTKGDPMKLKANMAAIVTGGASGLGEGSVRALAAQGLKLGIFDLNEDRGHALAKEVDGQFVKVDVSDMASVSAGFEQVRAVNGQERILVNCAGFAIGMKTASRSRRDGSIRPHDAQQFAKIINVNLLGSFYCASLSAAGMMSLDPLEDNERGVLIHTASVAAEDGQIGQVAYAASKGGIVSMTLPMARDLAAEGIRVLTIMPGFFETPIYEALKPEVKEALRQHLQFPERFGTPEEYADMVLTLIRSTYINAESVRLDAGARMPPS